MLLDPLVLRGGVSGTSESTNEEDKVHTVHSSNGHYFNYHLSLNVTESQNDDVCLNDKQHRFSFISGMTYSRQQTVSFYEAVFPH